MVTDIKNAERRKRFCRICKGLHPTVLHRYTIVKAENLKGEDAHSPRKEVNEKTSEAEHIPKVNVGALPNFMYGLRQKMCIIPVKVRASNGQLAPTYAFLDNGSTVSFCTKNLQQILSLKATGQAKLSVSTVQPQGAMIDCSVICGMEICGVDENNFINLPSVYTLDKIPVSKKDIISNEDLKEWPHIKSINIPEFDVEIGLMIGNNVPQALEPWEVINSKQNGAPFAFKTKLGWVVCGSTTESMRPMAKVNRVKINDVSVDQLLENLYNQDFHDLSTNKKGLSEEDRQWIKKTEKSCVRLDEGHYEIALPFRKETPDLVNNKKTAQKRIESLKTKFVRDPTYFAKYSEFVEDLFKKGYAEPAISSTGDLEECGKWYMPHHGVFHPQKPEKLRVVFDCASKYKGSSLNDHLLQGPDLANSLVEVLTRFRYGTVAFVADIESMFYQVKVPPKDREFLRFLWFPDGNLNKEPYECRMTVHVFGASSSPSCANFALRKTAEDYGKEHMSESRETVLKNFYVDDCLKSVPNEDMASRIAHDVKELCSKGGFNLTKYISNSRNLLQSFPLECQSKKVRELDLCRDSLPIERALGMSWDVESDKLKIAVILRARPPTKRGVMGVMESWFIRLD